MTDDDAHQILNSIGDMFGQKAIDVIINYPIQFEYYCRLYKFYSQRENKSTGLVTSE